MKPKKIHLPRFINLFFKGFFSFAAFTSFVILFPVMAHALTPVTVAWDANNPAPDGYIIYWGTSSGNLTNSHDAGSATQYTIPDLQEGATYYFAATAYEDDNGVRNESIPSEEISHTVGIQNNTHTITSSAGAHGSINPSGAVVVNTGEAQTFSITAAQDYQILEVRV
ncbi:MAG: fibronectin type III domain-containing protein, partial [Deltaproteobacteria bacterium]|nr:fibronectin type III domain-containing protein [Deltaproteobacteria bacterium]